MDEVGNTEENKRPYWAVAPIVGILLVIAAYFICYPGLFQSRDNILGIVDVQKQIDGPNAWADVYIEGKMQEIHYYDFRYYVDIRNSKSDDALNLRLSIMLNVDGITKKMDSEIVGTLTSGQSRRVSFKFVVEHIYFDAVAIITLYSGNAAVDQKSIN
jgi:hypothetical protein